MRDAHARPPASIRDLFKSLRKLSTLEDVHLDVLDPDQPDEHKTSPLPDLGSDPTLNRAFQVKAVPGLSVFPSLLSRREQIFLLDTLLHRDLSNPQHKTNLHLHYDVTYPDHRHGRGPGENSFFGAPLDARLAPKDATSHPPMTHAQMLTGKLRWMTLGGQYDWTNKVYPDEVPPAFPSDVAALLTQFFPAVHPQAAIVNFYSPGDTLSVHRDVSEACDTALISISIGCDAIFVVGTEHGSEEVALRLRSGDAVLMADEARFAWHGIPKILPQTCPDWLQDWPDLPPGACPEWTGWMKAKRVNLNVRQMK